MITSFIRSSFFTVRVRSPGVRTPNEVVDAPCPMSVFQRHLNNILNIILQLLVNPEVGLDDCCRSLPVEILVWHFPGYLRHSKDALQALQRAVCFGRKSEALGAFQMILSISEDGLQNALKSDAASHTSKA